MGTQGLPQPSSVCSVPQGVGMRSVSIRSVQYHSGKEFVINIRGGEIPQGEVSFSGPSVNPADTQRQDFAHGHLHPSRTS